MSRFSISVITPSLNQGTFIEDAILSVSRQDYPTVEHIVVDGGSTDQTRNILSRYPYLKVISGPDDGQSDAINKGFRVATGDLVGWLNADDYYLPGALKAVEAFADQNPSCDVIYGNSIHVNESGRLIRLKMEHEFDYHVLLYYGCYIDSNAVFFRRNVVQEQLFLDTRYRVVMDYEYFVRLAALGKNFRHLNRMLAAFRWHGSNNSKLQKEKGRVERLNIQTTWSALQLKQGGYQALAKIYRAKRMLLKTLNGSYSRELKGAMFGSCPTRWFDPNLCESVPILTTSIFNLRS